MRQMMAAFAPLVLCGCIAVSDPKNLEGHYSLTSGGDHDSPSTYSQTICTPKGSDTGTVAKKLAPIDGIGFLAACK